MKSERKSVFGAILLHLIMAFPASGSGSESIPPERPGFFSYDLLNLRQVAPSSVNPYSLTVAVYRRDFGSEYYAARIMDGDQLILSFDRCEGGLLPVPEDGFYRITCRTDEEALEVSGRFASEEFFSGIWQKADGKTIRFESTQRSSGN